MVLTRLRLSCVFLGFLAGAPGLAAQPLSTFKDLPAQRVEAPAISNMVSQGIMKPVGTAQFAPDAAETLGDFAVSVQRLFNLGQPAQATEFADVPPGSSLYTAIQSVAPYMGRLLLCSGCALTKSLLLTQPISRAQVTMIMAQVLVAQGKIALPTAAQTAAALANVADANLIPPPARPYFAAGVQGGIVALQPGNRIALGIAHTRAEVAVMLDGAQKRFSIPQLKLNQPR